MSLERIFGRLAQGHRLNPGDVRELQQSGQRIDRALAKLDGWSSPSSGQASFDHVTWRTAEGLVLPHNCAMLYMGSANPTQTIPTGTTTLLDTWDDPYTIAPEDTASFAHGLKVDAANGRLYVTGAPTGAVLEFYMGIHFTGTSDSNNRTLRWKADDGSQKQKTRLNSVVASGENLFLELSHRREVPATDTYYYLEVEQWSGGDLDVSEGMFYVARIR